MRDRVVRVRRLIGIGLAGSAMVAALENPLNARPTSGISFSVIAKGNGFRRMLRRQTPSRFKSNKSSGGVVGIPMPEILTRLCVKSLFDDEVDVDVVVDDDDKEEDDEEAYRTF